jgi:hypothetical protein
MSVTHLRFGPVGETMFPPRAPFIRDRLSARGVATAAANAEEKERGDHPGCPEPPTPPPPPHGGVF